MGYDNKLQELMETLEQNPKLYQEQEGYQAWRDLLALGVAEFKEKQVLIPSRFTTKEKDKRVFGGLIEPEKAEAINKTFKKSITEEKPQKKNLDAYIEQMSDFFRRPSQERDFQKIFYSQMFERVAKGAVSIIRKGEIKKTSSALRRLLAVGWGHKWPEAQIFLARLDKKKLRELGIYNKETLNKRRIQANAYFKNELRDKRLDEVYRQLLMEAEKDWKEYLGENGGQGGRTTPQGPENGGQGGGVPPSTPQGPENGGQGGGVPPTVPAHGNGGQGNVFIDVRQTNISVGINSQTSSEQGKKEDIETVEVFEKQEQKTDTLKQTEKTGVYFSVSNPEYMPPKQKKEEDITITVTDPNYAPPKPKKEEDITITVTDPNYAEPKGKTTLIERLEAKKYVYTYTPKVAGSKYQLTGKGVSDLYKKKNERN